MIERLSPRRLLGHPTWMAAVVFVALLAGGSVMAPDQAQALPNPLDIVTNADQVFNPMQWPVMAFKEILKFFFGDVGNLGKHIVNLLLSVPLLSDTGKFARLNQYRSYLTSGAWGILGLTFVVASMRYWLAGLAGSGAYEALTGFVRSCAAICGLLIYVPMFDVVSRIINELTVAIAVNPVVGDGLHDGIGTVAFPDLTGGGLVILLEIGVVIMALALLLVKVVVMVLLAIIFVALPLCIALWPVEELAWLARMAMQALFGVLLFPIVWAICFAVFTILPADALFPGNHGSSIDAMFTPLLMLAAFIIAFKLPFKILNQALGASFAPSVGVREARLAHSVSQGVRSGLRSNAAVTTASRFTQGRLF